jgi:hypothetical protein
LQCSPSDSSPDNSSLLGISWSSESSNPLDMMSSTYVSPATENDLFRCILACHSSLKPPVAMLEACLAHNNPFLAVLASCYEACVVNLFLYALLIGRFFRIALPLTAWELGSSRHFPKIQEKLLRVKSEEFYILGTKSTSLRYGLWL